ncbi:major facilitator superfamily domain-containing protein [Xylariaceae sp. FL1272]|nr:major facilitator superfamily domain-containing protein [Xylariaceae sp. FL1272]
MQAISPTDLVTEDAGMLNSFGVFQAYYELDALKSQSSFAIGWIGSTQSALFFVATLVVGPLFDLGYFRSLLWIGTVFLVVSMFLLSISHRFYQILLTQSVLFGLGAGSVFLPAPAVVAQHFDTRLGLATSIASVGSAIGGLIYPAIFTRVLMTTGFGWATRVIAFVLLGTSIGTLLMRSNSKPTSSRSIIDRTAFTDLPYMLLNLLLAVARTNIPNNLSNNLLIIINAGSLVGRVVLGYFADTVGSINMQTAVALVASVLTFSLLATHTPAAFVVVAALFGVASGTFLGLPVASIVRVSSDPSKIGTRLGMTLAIVGVGSLISYPIAGAILGSDEHWLGLILFAGLLLTASTVVLGTTRVIKLGKDWETPL